LRRTSLASTAASSAHIAAKAAAPLRPGQRFRRHMARGIQDAREASSFVGATPSRSTPSNASTRQSPTPRRRPSTAGPVRRSGAD
jgi:hypothetical protein